LGSAGTRLCQLRMCESLRARRGARRTTAGSRRPRIVGKRHLRGTEVLQVLAAKEFEGKVLLLGPRTSPMTGAVQEFGEELGLAMLPMLHTPLGAEGLRTTLAPLLPRQASPKSPIDVAEAVSSGWLEYQPKLDIHTVAVSGVVRFHNIAPPI